MRISDWSSDVCSSDLPAAQPATPRITTLADAANATVINPVVAEDSPGAVADSSANADTPAPRTHVVARGYSIWRLAEHYGVSRADLRSGERRVGKEGVIKFRSRVPAATIKKNK